MKIVVNNLRKKYIKRFWSKVNKTSKCWIWTKGKNSWGYGIFNTPKLKRKKWRAHRFSWTITYGKIPNKLLICHECDNKICVRPDHLFLGTQKDNIVDAVKKKRMASGNEHGSRTYPESRPRGMNHWKNRNKNATI